MGMLSADFRSASNTSKKDRRSRFNDVFDVFEVLVVTLVIVLFLNYFVIRQTVVVGGSMMNTLQDGERLLISDFFYTPKTGDIVVIQLPAENTDRHSALSEREVVVKRVIATEGQTVEIKPDSSTGGKTGIVFVDGERLGEPYIYRDYYSSEIVSLKTTVSEGHVFVMGDHRNISLDSRIFGEVQTDAILGQVLLRITPLQKFGGVD